MLLLLLGLPRTGFADHFPARAWAAFRTEFYPTYDYRPIWEAGEK